MASALPPRYIYKTRPILPELVWACSVGFALGMGLEVFMIKTGFYEVATKKEGERRADRYIEQEEYWTARRKREGQGQGQ